MTIKDKLSVGGFKVCPYDSSSKLASEFPGTDLFDGRNHFILFARQTHVAVYASIINEQGCRKTPRGVKVGVLAAVLEDVTDGDRMVGARTRMNVAIKRSELLRDFRFDIFVPANEIDSGHLYRVSVTADGVRLASREIRFFSIQEIRLVPTKWYSPLQGGILTGWNHQKRVASPGGDCGFEALVEFQLERRLPAGVEHLPEVEIGLISPDGKEECYLVEPTGPCDETDGSCEELCREDALVVRRWFCIDPDLKGIYCARLRCMNHVFASFLFSNQGEAVEKPWTKKELMRMATNGSPDAERIFRGEVEKHRPMPVPEVEDGNAMELPVPEDPVSDSGGDLSFDSLVGLTSLKQRMAQYTSLVRFNKLRQEAGLSSLSLPLHSMFLGAPGTGKTTVAKILGRKLKELGVLSQGHVVIKERSTLLGRFYNSESENTLKALEEARGGILFIDEAYQLCQPDDPRDPGRLVIEALMTALADESDRDWMLILAGYTKPMQQLFDINPGLRSRIPQSNIFTFEDFNAPELMEIAEFHLRRNNLALGSEARVLLQRRLQLDHANRGADFGNARHVVNLIMNEIIPTMASRVAGIESPSRTDLVEILPADIPPFISAGNPEREYRRIGFAV